MTFDEDDGAHANRIATIFAGPMVQPGQCSEHINHFNILRTLEDMYGLPHAGQSANVSPITDVWAAVPDHFAVSTGAANPDVAGTPFDVTVTAQDANGNTVTGYTGTVHFTSADPYGAALPADYAFTPADAGTHTFAGGATLFTAGTRDVTAGAAGGITGSANVNVVAAPAASFSIAVPDSVPSGVPFRITVSAVDPYGNVDTHYVTDPSGVVSFSTTTDSDPGVVLPPDSQFTATDMGMRTFDGVVYLTPGAQDLNATDTVSGITGTATVNVTAGPGAPGRGPWAPPAWWLAGTAPLTGGPTPSRGLAPAASAAPVRPVHPAGEADAVRLAARAPAAAATRAHVIDRVLSAGAARLLTDPLGEAIPTLRVTGPNVAAGL
jgi:hypothetical protein